MTHAQPVGGSADGLLWRCLACSYGKNFAGRQQCYKCDAEKQGLRSASPQPRRSRAKSEASAGSVGDALRGSQQRGHSNFQSALQKEVARISGGNRAPARMPPADADVSMEEEDEASADRLREQLVKLDGVISKLESIDHDSVVKILEERRAERADIRERLQALKPLAAQIRRATDARDKALKQHAALTLELADFKQLVMAKECLAADAGRDAEASQSHIDELVERQGQEHAKSLTARPVSPPRAESTEAAARAKERSLVQWMAGLALQSTPEVAASFQQWLGPVRTEPVQLGVVMEEPDPRTPATRPATAAEEEEEEEATALQGGRSRSPKSRSQMDAAPAAAGTPTAFAPFRQQRPKDRTLADPYMSAEDGPSGAATPKAGDR